MGKSKSLYIHISTIMLFLPVLLLSQSSNVVVDMCIPDSKFHLGKKDKAATSHLNGMGHRSL